MNKSIGTMIMATSLLLGACNPATDVNVKETLSGSRTSGSKTAA